MGGGRGTGRASDPRRERASNALCEEDIKPPLCSEGRFPCVSEARAQIPRSDKACGPLSVGVGVAHRKGLFLEGPPCAPRVVTLDPLSCASFEENTLQTQSRPRPANLDPPRTLRGPRPPPGRGNAAQLQIPEKLWRAVAHLNTLLQNTVVQNALVWNTSVQECYRSVRFGVLVTGLGCS